MTDPTLTIDEHVLRKARIRALELGTLVNVVVREYLRQLAGAVAGGAAADPPPRPS